MRWSITSSTVPLNKSGNLHGRFLADEYIELVKGRLYTGDAARAGACVTLRTTFDTLCRMLAPFIPYFSEECYSYSSERSVHSEGWPEFSYADDRAESEGDLLVRRSIRGLRRYKHEKGLALNAPLGRVTIHAGHSIDDAGDAARTLNADVAWSNDRADLAEVVTDVQFNMGVIGPALRKQAKGFMEAVKALPKEQLVSPPPTVMVDGDYVNVPKDSLPSVHVHGGRGKGRRYQGRRSDRNGAEADLIASFTNPWNQFHPFLHRR